MRRIAPTRHERLAELSNVRNWASRQDREVLNLIVALAAEDLTRDYVMSELKSMARDLYDADDALREVVDG